MRKVSDTEGELIFYQRPDHAGPKESRYFLVPTSCPDALRENLALAYGVIGRVRKLRVLFGVGRTRIHLDRVEGLGDFLELEVVMTEHESLETGRSIAQELLQTLGVSSEQLVSCAYVDLLEHKR